ncbi:hypothetical protein I7I51_00892 [Histoplasma capsulatum]|uniref:Uncharacterized protein n=1 Tax=Ajellomyces capsulatus TaxID=5037 RepID=A0A8A1MGY6_AJECA|nr:hypothetical protein I7I51_00892 [Histoplasma capsulatum]
MSPEKKHRNRRWCNPASSAQGDGTEPDGEAAHDDPSVSPTDKVTVARGIVGRGNCRESPTFNPVLVSTSRPRLADMLIYQEWEDAWSVLDIEHQLQDHGGKSDECRQCGTMREEPRKRDYFPKQPSACSLGKVLASEAGVTHIDKLDVLEKRARPRDMRKRQRVKGN